ncbi:MAG: hypothetical protein RI894_547, partial [Bacteroidota bacterium]
MHKRTLTFIYATLLQLLLLNDNVFAQSEQYLRLEFAAMPAQLDILARKGIDLEHIGRLENNRFSGDFSVSEGNIIQQIASDIRVKNENIGQYYATQNLKGFNGGVAAVSPNSGAAVSPNGVAAVSPRGFRFGAMGGYLNFGEYASLMDSLHVWYPAIVSEKLSIGTTYEGRPIYTFKISDNVAVDEPEPEVLFTALIHAREPISATQLWYYVCDLVMRYAQNDPEARFIINNRELYFLPVWNVDGYVYNQQTNPQGGGLWRKNRRLNIDGTFGVDLNRNFGTGFGFDDNGSSPIPQTMTYRGTSPFSEPEAAAVRDWCNSRQFKTAFNHHAYSNVLVRPVSYDETIVCPDEAVFDEYSQFLTVENGYLSGRNSEVLGYHANGVVEDWQYLEQNTKPKIIAFLPETGSNNVGFWPPMDSIMPYCQLMQPANNKLAWLAGEYITCEPRTTSDSYSTTVQIPFSLRNIGQTGSLPFEATVVSNNLSFIGSDTKYYTSLASFATKTDTLVFICQPSTPDNTVVSASIRITIDGYSQDFPFLVRYHYINTASENAENSFFIQPNPAHNAVTLHFDDKLKTAINCIKLQNSLGQTFFTITGIFENQITENQLVIPLDNL